MAKLWTKKTATGLIPHDPTEEAFTKLKTGESFLIEIKRVRDPRHHRKFFALLKLVFENQDELEMFDQFRQVFQMRCGLVDVVKTHKTTLYLPKSIAFDKMDQTAFEELYNKALDQAELMLGSSRDEIRDALANFY